MKRVGFVLSHTDSNWVGGLNYLSNLLYAIEKIPDRQIEPVLFVPPETSPSFMSAFPPWETIKTVLARTGNKGWGLARKLSERGLGQDFLLENCLRKNRIDLLSHSEQLGKNASLPTVCWIPDFQHLRMPEFFSQHEVEARNRGYGRLIKNCTTVLLSSADAQKDLAGLFPDRLQHSRVLHFVPGFSSTKDTGLTEKEIRAAYALTGPFFVLPNQFWVHKNHHLVIRALHQLKERGHDIKVLCTGQTADRRKPDYFKNLEQEVKRLGLEGNFKVLGLVPYSHLSILLTMAVAVINPSKFEGWSTSVEEAKSLGLRILLSDIPVHREQDPKRGVFFDPDDPTSLADAILQVEKEYCFETEQIFREQASQELNARFIAFGEAYQKIALETIAAANGGLG
jgi:glycosyltransferase involved in cell wall biosynthesis